MSRTEKRSSGAIRAAWLVLLAVGLVASALRAAGAAQATDLTVVLTPKTVGPIAQGAAFRFFVKITNNGNTGAQDTVVERIEPVSGTASPVDFVQDRRLVPAHSTLTLSHDIATPQYFSQIGTFRITPLIAGVAAGAPLEFDVTAPTVLPPTFQDVTAQAGVGDAVLPSPVCDGQSSAGSAWADVDGDGDLDLYLPLPDQASRLYINDGTSQFTDQAAQFGVRNQGSVGRGAVFADYDNDGDPDLYVLNEGDNRLYRNDGGATGFTDVTTTAGVGDPGWSQSGSWGDFDQDGYLDLYVTDYADCAWNYQNDRLYHNNGNGTFTDVTSYLEHGPGCADGCTIGSGFQAAWFDYDSDNDLDLYLANDFNEKGPSPDPNHLWRNDGSDGQGGWTFTDVSAASGTALSNLQSMGIGISDVDGDLDPDLAISDIAGNRVLRNNGNGT